MSIELLAKQGHSRVYEGLAAVDSVQLQQMRNDSLRCCFLRMEDSPNRLNTIANVYGLEYINDAAARSVNATLYALQHTTSPTVWIAFGNDNDTDYTPLRALALRKVSLLIVVGHNSDNLRRTFADVIPTIEDTNSIAQAVQLACYSGLDHGTVLLSPATRLGQPTDVAGAMFTLQVNEL